MAGDLAKVDPKPKTSERLRIFVDFTARILNLFKYVAAVWLAFIIFNWWFDRWAVLGGSGAASSGHFRPICFCFFAVSTNAMKSSVGQKSDKKRPTKAQAREDEVQRT